MSDSVTKTTLCYICRDDSWLFIHKARENDPNSGYYLGVGGHFEEGETDLECIKREIYEETTLDPDNEIKNLRYAGEVYFRNNIYGDEKMIVFKADINTQREICPGNCPEGNLTWRKISDTDKLPVWEGDRIMFECLKDEKPFLLELIYEGKKLIRSIRHDVM